MLDLWERKDDAAGTFSKGMRQKLAIARALLHEPQVLFLDEPTAGLDPQAARLIRDFIGELRSQGRTIFLCSHNLDEVDRLCDRVAVFQRRLRVLDTPANLRRQLYGRRISIQLAEPAEKYMPLVVGLSGISDMEATGHTLTFRSDNPEQDNPQIIRRLVEAGAAVQFAGEQKVSLEEVYLQLVDENPGDGKIG
jgi:ABC-2 type transport system ATP-binding protein